MAGANYQVFPEDIENLSNMIAITTYETYGQWQGNNFSSTPKDIVYMFTPAGQSNGPFKFEHRHEYTEIKLARAALDSLGVRASQLGQAALNMAGVAINPFVEVLYRTTDLRDFQFTFLMAPTSEKESRDMHSIIKTLRHAAAPDLLTGSIAFKSPYEVDVEFYTKQNGVFAVNNNIPKIGRSVITRIDVDFAPQGEFSTFTNGAPVSCMMDIVLKELRIIDKDLISQGY